MTEGKPKKRNKVRLWLEDRVKRDANLSIAAAVGLLLFGAFVTYITFWITHGIVLFTVFRTSSLSDSTPYYFTSGFLILLFIANLFSDREHLENLDFETGGSARVTIAVGRKLGLGSMAAIFAGPKNVQSVIKIVSTIILSGPRLITLAWRFLLKAKRLKTMKTGSCAKIISLLIKQQTRISLSELYDQNSEIDLQTVIPQLQDIDGVVFLLEEPPGLSVAPRLLQDFQEWKTENA